MPAADLEFLDSSMHYDTATKYMKYEVPGGGIVDPGAGRFGVDAIKATLLAGGPLITFKRNLLEVYTGAAFKVTGLDVSKVLTLGNNGSTYIQVQIRADGRIQLVNGSNQVVVVSLVTFDINTWYYLELSGLITPHTGGTGGSLLAKVHLNEVEIITYATSNDSQYNAVKAGGGEYFTQAGRFVIGAGNGWTCDHYVHATAFLGDIKVRVIRPNGTGTFNNWLTSGAASDWQATDDAAPNGNTDYIYSHTPDVMGTGGDKTSVNMEDVNLDGGDCLGIQFLVNVRKTDANVRKVKAFTLEGGTEGLGVEFSMPTDYVFTHDCQDVNPRTSSAWTETELNAIELGVRLTK